jgi:hypothetical protein
MHVSEEVFQADCVRPESRSSLTQTPKISPIIKPASVSIIVGVASCCAGVHARLRQFFDTADCVQDVG